MKRFHAHVMVEDLESSVRFYSTLFGTEPAVLKADYAKWMLDDPRVNFAITAGSTSRVWTISGYKSKRMKNWRPFPNVSTLPGRRSSSKRTPHAVMRAAIKVGYPIRAAFRGRPFTPLARAPFTAMTSHRTRQY